MMSSSGNDGVIALVIWIITIIISIGSGFLAWNLVDPESFLGAIGFIIIWGLLSRIGHFLALGIATLISGNN